jgi:hypothetical protein
MVPGADLVDDQGGGGGREQDGHGEYSEKQVPGVTLRPFNIKGTCVAERNLIVELKMLILRGIMVRRPASRP